MISRFFLLFFFFFSSLVAANPLSSFGKSASDEPLDPKIAFQPSVRAIDGQRLEVRFAIAKGYYLYRDKFRFESDNLANPLGKAEIPRGKKKKDENYGDVEVFYDEVKLEIPVMRASSGKISFVIDITSQGCADQGICYLPTTERRLVELPDPTNAATLQKPDAPKNSTDESGDIAKNLATGSFFLSLVFFFFAGLGLSLTPCVLPMIPILSAIIAADVGNAEKTDKKPTNGSFRGFSFALIYVLGMALTYAILGVAAAYSGTLVAASLQNIWVLGAFSLIFVALALSMFGFYSLQIPIAIQNVLNDRMRRLPGGRFGAVFMMGILSALLVGPCVAAPLAGVLIYIGQSGDAMLGGLALFVMALGMGIPLLVVGAMGSALLPRSGAWMDRVKKTFGVLLLLAAFIIILPVLPALAVMLGWAIFCIFSATYLRVLEPLPVNAKGIAYFLKALALFLLLVGILVLMGAASGGRDPLQPLSGWQSQKTAAQKNALPFIKINSIADLEKTLSQNTQPLMLDFYADWCASCQQMERETFSDPEVQAALSRFRLLKADVTANTADHHALLKKFGLFGPPGILFFTAAGKEIEGVRIVGFQTPEKFLESLKNLPLSP